MGFLKRAAKAVLPQAVLAPLQRYRAAQVLASYDGLSTKEAFTRIYETNAWGAADESGDPFNSGTGSREEATVRAYVEAVGDFLRGLDHKPDVVDLGCGDFWVGSQLRPLCGNYVACDVVEPLIERNRMKFKDAGVDFRVVDIVDDALPDGELVFIRQVLQHLSNRSIEAVLRKLGGRYRYLMLTEHLPFGDGFVPNMDKPDGPGVRVSSGSGVVVTRPPFDLAVRSERSICAVPQRDAVIQTVLYELA